jgi:hypothetical protein
LRSGNYFDFANPTPDQVLLSDIAGALSKVCRFGGQINKPFYSIAEHCLNCERLAKLDGHDIGIRAAVLFHDAAEAFCGDVVKPLKVMLEPNYQIVEARVANAIAERFSIDFDGNEAVVKQYDHIALFAEKRALFDGHVGPWPGEETVRHVDFDVQCWWPAEAEARFVDAARELGITESATKCCSHAF